MTVIENFRLFVEYTGSLNNQNWYYNNTCTTFWTLPDVRQITDCLTEHIYRHILKTMDNVRPFVPKTQEDWAEIIKIMEAEEKKRVALKKAERISYLEGMIKSIAGEASKALDKAASLRKEATVLKKKAATVAQSAEQFADELEALTSPPADPPIEDDEAIPEEKVEEPVPAEEKSVDKQDEVPPLNDDAQPIEENKPEGKEKKK